MKIIDEPISKNKSEYEHVKQTGILLLEARYPAKYGYSFRPGELEELSDSMARMVVSENGRFCFLRYLRAIAYLGEPEWSFLPGHDIDLNPIEGQK